MSAGYRARPLLRRVLPAALLLSAGFVGGWAASRKLTAAPRLDTLRQRLLAVRDDASPAVRAGILDALAALQTAYTRRDPAALPDLMRRCFDAGQGVLLIGTDPGEWISGYEAVGRFISHDWTSWGDLRLVVADARVSASGATAWLATIGTVGFGRTVRPLRFTAVLSAYHDRWVFRQLQFQWDEQPLQTADLLHPLRLAMP